MSNSLGANEKQQGMTVVCPNCHAPIAIPTMLNVQQCPRCGQRLMIASDLKGVLVHYPCCREAIRAPGLSSDQGANETSVVMVCPQCHASVNVSAGISNRPTPCPSCGKPVYFRDALRLKGGPKC